MNTNDYLDKRLRMTTPSGNEREGTCIYVLKNRFLGIRYDNGTESFWDTEDHTLIEIVKQEGIVND